MNWKDKVDPDSELEKENAGHGLWTHVDIYQSTGTNEEGRSWNQRNAFTHLTENR